MPSRGESFGLRAGRTLGHFKLLELIGAGGMGMVFKARDTKLDRIVALKVLSEQLFENETAQSRFLREAQLAGSISHPNVATIYEVDEEQGTPFIAMEFVPGSNLSRMLRAGPLPLDQVLFIGCQVCDALDAAHRLRVIHRDIKSSNIVVTPEGRVKVLDFGLARSVSASPAVSDDHLTPVKPLSTAGVAASPEEQRNTRPGVALGTPSYMSPEQASGQSADSRSDIFSLGVVLYEATSGSLPFQGRTDHEVLGAIRNEDPPPLHLSGKQTPRAFSQIIEKCLAKDPQKRFGSASELRGALIKLRSRRFPQNTFHRILDAAQQHRWVLVTVGVIVSGFIAESIRRRPTPDASKIESVRERERAGLRVGIVLPQNLSGRPEIAAWPHLIQMLLVSELTGVGQLGIVEPLSLNTLFEGNLGSEAPPRDARLYELLRREGLSLVIDGSIVVGSGGYELRANVVDPETREIVFSQVAPITSDAELPDVLRSLSNKILGFMQVHLLGLGEDRDLRPWISLRRDKIEAVKAFLQARQYAYRHEPGGGAYYRRAIELDPAFIAPKIWLLAGLVQGGEIEEAQTIYGELQALEPTASPFEQAMIAWSGALLRQDLPAQIRHLTIALTYSPLNNVLLSNLAFSRYLMEDYQGAVDAMKPAVEARFRYPPLYTLWGLSLAHLGRLEESKKDLESALSIKPVDPHVYALLEALSIVEGDRAEAEHYQKLYLTRLGQLGQEASDSDLGTIYEGVAVQCRKRGMVAQAVELFRKAIAADPLSPEFHSGLAEVLYSMGDLSEAEEHFRRVLELNPEWPPAHLRLGEISERRGEQGDAMAHYEAFLSFSEVGADSDYVRERLDILRRQGSP